MRTSSSSRRVVVVVIKNMIINVNTYDKRSNNNVQ